MVRLFIKYLSIILSCTGCKIFLVRWSYTLVFNDIIFIYC